MNRLQAAGVGVATLKDWLGVGGVPVVQDQAEQRASVCKTCPKNKPGNWWDWISREVAHVILSFRRAKAALNLRVKCEEDLHFCEVCHCDLKTKVWVPMERIAKHTSEKVWSELPSWCWLQADKPK
jgi:hypothetical protein